MELIRKKQDMSKYDNFKIGCIDLEIILTQKCNLACQHCMRGDCTGKEISEDVLDALFSKVVYVENLALGGGEIALVPDKIKLLTQKLKKHKTIVHHSNFTSNGTLVSNEVLDALAELRDYVVSCENAPSLFKPAKDEKDVPMFVCFSFDDYHLDQIIKNNISIEKLFHNIALYQKRFGEDAIQCRMECDMDIYDEGRAKNLPASEQKVSMQKVLSEPYPYIESKIRDFIFLGNIICVSCDGNIIPVNIPFSSEKALSFGNVKTDSTSQILSNMKTIKTDDRGFNKARADLFKAMTAPKQLQKKYKPYLNEKLRIFFTNLEIMSQEMQ